MPLQSTSGAASYDAFGGGVAAKVNYIEDFFQSYLRTGTGASATITTGLDGSTKETLVWTKSRSAATNHKLTDNVRGATKALSSNTTSAEATDSQGLTAFSATGYTIGTNTDYNNSGATYVDWQWVSQPKFFDVVTYTGNGVSGRTIAHNLGSAPGCIIIKRLDDTTNWAVYHRSIGATKYLIINSTAAAGGPFSGLWNDTDPSSTTFTLGNDGDVNASGSTYVAYLFAHDAGGFGLTGTDNVISCGSYTGSGGVDTITLGYEPQWVLMKATNNTGPWRLFDTFRGMSYTDNVYLDPSTSGAEVSYGTSYVKPTPTGFTVEPSFYGTGTNVIYIAIRRGPMKVPTSGTSVFSPNAYTGGTAGTSFNLGFVPDTLLTMRRDTSNFNILQSRLTGLQYMLTHATDAEAAGVAGTPQWDANTGTIKLATATSVTGWNASGFTYVNEVFARAPNFFDEVCYTGTGSNTTQTHNLTVAPELVIIKSRSNAIVWVVGNTAIGFGNYLLLNATDASASGSNVFNSTAPTSTVFSIGSGSGTNQSGATYVAYLFATLAGVSKVGSYTGNGSSQTINCGFTGGARFVLIKKSSGTGDWMVADSARGIVSGNDPYLELNNTNAEVTGEDWLDTDSTGFVVNEVSGSNANTSGATYIFLAIA